MTHNQRCHAPGTSRPVYPPTSLDFINRPNPVEPQSVPHRHPLNGTPRLPNASDPHHLRRLLEYNANASNERPSKRRKSGDGKRLDLPQLPVRQGSKRPRLPPTLSGLYQPPPDAGLLPSISVEKPVATTEDPLPLAPETAGKDGPIPSRLVIQTVTGDNQEADEAVRNKTKRNRWSDEETACLLKGVARFGIGNWTKILNCEDCHFERRTALDLKDRFRVCCPNDYRRTKKAGYAQNGGRGKEALLQGGADYRTHSTRYAKNDRKSKAELQSLGIDQPFTNVKRRTRHSYSAEEDEALLEGFQKHGNSWAAIREDDELGLSHRTATDLRDRFRTKYPEQYKEAGLAPRPEVFPTPPQRNRKAGDGARYNGTKASATSRVSQRSRDNSGASEKPAKKETGLQSKPMSSKKQFQQPLLAYDDVFFGASLDGNDTENEPVVLDRGILDLFGDSSRPFANDSAKICIDPLATLQLPRPIGGVATQPALSQPQGNSMSALPSVAAITSDSQLDLGSQLELPSLVLGPFESDGRASGQFPSLDELLS